MGKKQAQKDLPALETLRQLCNDFNGSVCSVWRKGYGYTGTLHFGRMHPVENPHPGSVDADQGAIMLNFWSCDRVLSNPLGASVVDSRLHKEEESLMAFHALEGKRVSTVELDETELSLRLVFTDGHSVVLLVDSSQKGKNDEQWAVESGSGPSAGVFGLDWVRSTVADDS